MLGRSGKKSTGKGGVILSGFSVRCVCGGGVLLSPGQNLAASENRPKLSLPCGQVKLSIFPLHRRI